MVKINRPPLPAGIHITSETDYRSEPVHGILAAIFHGKCYICESKSTTIHVEHRVHHAGNPTIKYDWNNLFLSCGHCNQIKSIQYDDILDPATVDPEDYITLEFYHVDNAVVVEKTNEKNGVDSTVSLLQHVYHNDKTPTKRLECRNLREQIGNVLASFLTLLDACLNESNSIGKSQLLADELSRKGEFAAFKRHIVRSNPVKYAALQQYL